ncbi:hybrid sensor histidine kinase/response regulator [Sphingobacterium hotanense]|uniref:hybrid sensor histidine kinase/response regulator n=1 Tax=Sphingobacterium hotanense TaxID=649196 RepID=UPI0021A5BBE7|nr:hybrid sensor histidine kinase/response regulator [Sphingobacterium hotanense]MCT1524673.1 hybrid sensor histidine kinase/response regulator [Sphingobacterium hotanense]
MNIQLNQFYILVAEDNPIHSLILENILRMQGYGVLLADSFDKAFSILSKDHVDLILMDVIMGDMSGFDIVKTIMETPEYQDIPVMFITSLDSTEDIIRGFDAGAVDYIRKPFEPQILLRRVRQQINLLYQRKIIEVQKKSLEAAIASRDQIYAIISHDLRTPIASLKMILNILSLQEVHKDQESLRQMVYSGNDIAEQLFSLLDNLLKWTKSRLGMLSFVPQSVQFDEVIFGVVEVLRPTALLKDITIETCIESCITIYFDTDILKSVIRNLLINALKFSHQGSSVKILLYSEGSCAVMEVVDTGIGMDESIQKSIRESMPSGSRPGTANEQGSGLGLWIVKQFVQGKEGEFFFESVENQGSKFGLRIPKLDRKEL